MKLFFSMDQKIKTVSKFFSYKIHILRKKLFQMQSIPSLQLNSLRRYRQIKELAHMEMEKIATIFKVVFFSMNPKIENVWIFFQIRFINYPKSCFKLDQSHLSSCIRWGGICKSRLLAHMEMGKIATIFKVVFFSMNPKIENVWILFQIRFINYPKSLFKWDQSHFSSWICWDVGKLRLLACMKMGKVTSILKVVFVSLDQKSKRVSIFFQMRFINY